MALYEELISFILLLSLFSLQIHAREGHFLSKVSHDSNVQNTNNNIKDAQLAIKEDHLNKQKPKPETKQTSTSEKENSYGLYDQETSQTINYTPYITTADGGRIYDLNKDPLLKNQQNMADIKFQEKHESYNGENGYHPDQKEERFSGSSYTTTKAYDDKYYNGHNRYEYNYDEQPNFYYMGGNMHDNHQQGQGFKEAKFADNGYNTMSSQNNGGDNYSDVQKQGLSDTRFLEDGRYFYDVSKDKYNHNQYDNNREMSSRNGYNKKNYLGGYQNQEEFEENDISHGL